MSWIEKVQAELIITTGDGKIYKPLWMPATKTVDYNIAEFEFPNLAGTLVNRGTPKGAKYSIKIFFQGEDHLETSLQFEQSANDSRPWIIEHPLYGNLTVQPTGLTFDNSKYNVAEITGTVIETITNDNPKITVNPIDNISLNKENLDNTFVNSFNETPAVSDINRMTTDTNKLYQIGAKSISIISESEAYFNLFNAANAAILNASALPLIAIRAMQSFINYPSLLSISVKNRVSLLSSQFSILRDSLSTITKKPSKKIYENNAGAIISAQALAAATPIEGNYGNRNDVLAIIEILVQNYNQYITDLDSLQSINGGDVESYIPDAQSLIALNSLVNFTVSSLFTIALNAKQERSIILEDDSNIILLTHRFYGADPNDANMDEFIKNNDIGLNEILQIKKGRKIVYYV